MSNKDQEAIAKLYLENYEMSEFETEAPYKEPEPFIDSNEIRETVFEIVSALENRKIPLNVIVGMLKDIIAPHNLEEVKDVIREIRNKWPNIFRF